MTRLCITFSAVLCLAKRGIECRGICLSPGPHGAVALSNRNPETLVVSAARVWPHEGSQGGGLGCVQKSHIAPSHPSSSSLLYELLHGKDGGVQPLDMVDKSTEPFQTHFGPFFGDEAV